MNPAVAMLKGGEEEQNIIVKSSRVLPIDEEPLLKERTHNTGPMTWDDLENNWEKAGYCCWHTSCVVTLVGSVGVTVGGVIWLVLHS